MAVGHRFTALRPDLAGHFPGAPDVVDDHLGAAPRELEGVRAPHPAPGSGDDSDFSVEPQCLGHGPKSSKQPLT
jgi:hypothetical protein